MSKKVFITGSEGFTGRYVCAEFSRLGWEVWRAGTRELIAQERYVQVDLLDIDSLAVVREIRPDVVIHLGGVSFVANNNPNAYYGTHIVGTRNLLEAISNGSHRPESVILASSSNVYGNPGEGKLKESAALKPVSDYAVSKLAMEWVSKLFANDLNVVIARCFNYTGVGQSERFLIPKIIRHFRDKSKVIELGNVDVSRDFSDVRDIAQYYVAVALAKIQNETLNFCSGTAHSLHEIITHCEEISRHSVEVRVNPEFVRHNEIKTLVGDNKKLNKFPLISGPRNMRETLQWMLAETT